ncbi:MAG: aminodeoxychorismate/anthranilate synthase component II [Planctomycetaceae bacterium]|nr:aminodeoxychorismate/anthranilate synthase component II [Planctomycetaceae bacterium]
MIVLIDNYDSFVYNLARYLEELGQPTTVVRNDAMTVAELRRLQPAALVLSPGPGTPEDAGICMDAVRELGPEVPLLGVCLGHQAIAAASGGLVVRSPLPVHGRSSEVVHQGHPLFAGMPSPFTAARYHSLLVDESTLPDSLEIIARTTEGLPMAIAHRTHRVFGVQFHPESVLTTTGHRLLAAFLGLAGLPCSSLPPGDMPAPRQPESWPPVPDSFPPAAADPGDPAEPTGNLPLHW